MGFVADAVSSVVSWVGDTISNVVDTVGDVISGALKNPLGTIAQIAAVATGNLWALPVIAGVQTAANGGNLMDVFKSVAISAIAQKVSPMVGNKVESALGTVVNPTVANIVASGAASATVAIVRGQDPLEAFVGGGIGAALSAAAGYIDDNTGGKFATLPKSAQSVILASVEAQLTGGNVTATAIGTALRTSEYVTNALNELGILEIKDDKGNVIKPVDLSPQNQAIISNILYNTATAAMTGTSASTVVQAALFNAGSKAIANMASLQFDKLTGKVVEVYNEMTGQVQLIQNNEDSQQSIINNYNSKTAELQGKVDKVNALESAANAAIAKFNADRTSQANYDKAQAAIKAYNDYAAVVNTEYTNTYKPLFDTYLAQLDALQATHTDLTSKFDDLNLQFNESTGNLDLAVDKVVTDVNKDVTTAMDPTFNAKEYAAINGLDSSVDAYNHWLTTGKNNGLYTSLADAQADIDAKQTKLMQSVLSSLGLNINQVSNTDLAALEKTITEKYGTNLNALSSATAADVIGNLTKEQMFVDSAKTGFKADTNTTVYGDWNPPTSTTLPAGMRLATKEEYIAGITKQYIDSNGNVISYVPDPNSAPQIWSNTDGSMTIKTDPVYITDSSATVTSAVARVYTLASFPNAEKAIDQIAIDAAKNLKAQAEAAKNPGMITNNTLDAATKAQTLKSDITSIFDFSKVNGLPVDGPNTALFGGNLSTTGSAGTPITTLGPMSNKYSLLGYGGTFFLKDLSNDRVYSIINVGTSTILRDAVTNIEVTLTPDQAKVLQSQIAGGTAGNLDTVPGASDIQKMATGMSATNGKSVAENTTTINNQIAAGTTSLEDAKNMLKAAGFTNPTDAEAQQFVSIRNSDATSKTAIEAWADPQVTAPDEVAEFFKDIGYTPTDEEIAKFVGKIAETKTKTDVGTYADPLMVDATEVAEAFKAMGIKYPDPADVEKFVGQYNESLLQSKIDPSKADIQFRSLQYQLDQIMTGEAGGTGGTTALNDLQKKISDQMAANEAAGMSRADALNKAIQDVSSQLNTTADQLAASIGVRYVGPTEQDATAIQNIIASGSGGTGASDLKYDYNGDGKVDNADLSAIQGFIGGTGGAGGSGTGTGGVGGGTGTGAGTGFAPGAGTVWDQPTGIYKTIADEAEATRLAQEEANQQAAAKATANARALALQAQQNQQVTNTSQLMNWLAQADDASGQKVTVNQSPLAEIKNVYDWKSIFATPQQEKMFVTPYKEGGTVEDLYKILKG